MRRCCISLCVLVVFTMAAPAFAVHACYGVPFDLTIAEEALFGDGFRVGVAAVVDSRCPIGAMCCWEGDASVDLLAAYPQQDPVEFSLHTFRLWDQSFVIGDREVTLIDVAPFPSIALPPLEPGDYLITLKVVELNGVDTDAATWGAVKSLYR